jgi:hypothetical protein
MKLHATHRKRKILLIALILAVGIALFAAKQYVIAPYLSYKDFATVQQRIDNLAIAMNFMDATKDKRCRYSNISSDESASDYRLSCSTTLSAPISITSRQEFEELAKRLEKHMQVMQADVPISLQDWQGKDYYHKYAAFRVRGAGYLMSCHIDVKGGNGGEAQSTSSPLDKATVELGCGGLSKDPYFEMR